MKKSKIAMGIMVFIIAALLLIGVPICINLCFKPENRWTAGNVLTYYGATLSFLGTVIFRIKAGILGNSITEMKA